MREITDEIFVPGCTAQQYHDIVYADDVALTAYHKQNFIGDVTSSPWDDGRTNRVVSYSMPVNAPAVVKKLIGMDVIPVEEEQHLKWDGSKTLVVNTIPRPKIPGADNFVTNVQITAITTPEGDCRVLMLVTCTCKIWAMQSIVETTMEKEAKDTLGKWAAFCRDYVPEQLKKERAAAVPATPSPPTTAPHVVRGGDESDDEFHDVLMHDEDGLPEMSPEPVEHVSANGPEEEGAVPAFDRSLTSRGPMRFEEAVLAYMQALHGSCRDSATASSEMARELAALRTDLASALTPPPTPAAASSMRATTTASAPPRTQGSSFGLLCLVFAGGVAAGAIVALTAAHPHGGGLLVQSSRR